MAVVDDKGWVVFAIPHDVTVLAVVGNRDLASSIEPIISAGSGFAVVPSLEEAIAAVASNEQLQALIVEAPPIFDHNGGTAGTTEIKNFCAHLVELGYKKGPLIAIAGDLHDEAAWAAASDCYPGRRVSLNLSQIDLLPGLLQLLPLTPASPRSPAVVGGSLASRV